MIRTALSEALKHAVLCLRRGSARKFHEHLLYGQHSKPELNDRVPSAGDRHQKQEEERRRSLHRLENETNTKSAKRFYTILLAASFFRWVMVILCTIVRREDGVHCKTITNHKEETRGVEARPK